MRKSVVVVFLCLLFSCHSVFATVVDKQLRGEGTVRYLGMIKVYEARLYADAAVESTRLLSTDVSRCLELDYAVSLSRDDMIEAAWTVLERQHPAAVLQGLQPEIEILHSSYRDVDAGDSYALCYDAARQSTTLSLNGKPLSTIVSQDFARIYFGIWLGEESSLDDTLRRRLLSM